MTTIDDIRTPMTEDPSGFFGTEGGDGAAALDPAVIELFNELVAAAPAGKDGLLTVLLGLQRAFDRVSWRIQELVADRYGLSPVQVAAVVSFCPGLSSERRGRPEINVCTGTACHLRRSDRLVGAFVDAAGRVAAAGGPAVAVVGERCLGVCGLAPVVRVGGTLCEGPEPEHAEASLRHWLETPALQEGPE